MENSFLKAAVRQTTLAVDANSGEILDQDVKTFNYLANTKEHFFIIYAQLIGVFQQLTLPEVKVYCYLLQSYNVGTEIGIYRPIREIMGEKLNLNERTIANTLRMLVDKKLLYSTVKGIYKLNPRYAFQGSTKDRNAMLKVVLELECPDC